MDDVVAYLLLCIIMILYMKSFAPERFCHSWFWGVTEVVLGVTARYFWIGRRHGYKGNLQHVEHRQCARHIYANFRKVYSGLEFKNMFWAAAKSTVEGDFIMNTEKIKAINPSAYEHLIAMEPKSCYMAYYQAGLACKAVENGMVECFNGIIIYARKKPFIDYA
uniref:Uncharacterized protein n=1 Tax=Lactuca sativa TaxID=4236 RepID=A0A9R1XBP5_LACSA|nr:hypothetical protein LSAT_V11C500288800 [Lactuca sativa]